MTPGPIHLTGIVDALPWDLPARECALCDAPLPGEDGDETECAECRVAEIDCCWTCGVELGDDDHELCGDCAAEADAAASDDDLPDDRDPADYGSTRHV